MTENGRYIQYPRVEDLHRMRTYIERSIVEIDYDIKRNKQRSEDLVRQREEALSTLKEINAYIDATTNND